MKGLLGAVAAALSISSGTGPAAEHHKGRSRRPDGWRAAGRSSCYRPHQGERERERRVAQAERNHARQCERAAAIYHDGSVARLSRRGRPVAD